ncbi:hypothetical protein ACFW9I_37030, partial [[Kitasatospora] papulosa]|uniref:hypothetical protein n=1 Tax=[Kitasatospora] papulosa TaxID=1464011 RepID=UPI0036CF321B
GPQQSSFSLVRGTFCLPDHLPDSTLHESARLTWDDCAWFSRVPRFAELFLDERALLVLLDRGLRVLTRAHQQPLPVELRGQRADGP